MSKRTNDSTNPRSEDNKRQGISATLLRPSRRSLSLVTWGGGVNHNDTGGGGHNDTGGGGMSGIARTVGGMSHGGSSGGWNTGSLRNIIGGNIGGGKSQGDPTYNNKINDIRPSSKDDSNK